MVDLVSNLKFLSRTSSRDSQIISKQKYPFPKMQAAWQESHMDLENKNLPLLDFYELLRGDSLTDFLVKL